jgi:hypothetical protein
VPDGDPSFTHVAEGPDDMPSHVKGRAHPHQRVDPGPAGRARPRHLAGPLRLGAPRGKEQPRGARPPDRGVIRQDALRREFTTALGTSTATNHAAGYR